jgi:hypothetical protein
MGRIGPDDLGRLFDEHAGALVLFARQWCDAPEDVVQDAFVALARQEESPERALAWLFRVVRNGAHAAALKQLAAAKKGPFVLFVEYVAGIYPAMMAELRLERRIAALRVIEAIRLYAAAHDAALPESLGQITEVPVPEDPATGKPFEYHRDGSSATVSGPEAGLPPPLRPSYRITIRH